jgi:Tfp pilus assembly protein PilN
MGELLFWTFAVFAVLAGPPLVFLVRELRRDRNVAHERERQRRLEEAHKEHRQRNDGAPESSPPAGVWPGMLVLAWAL